LTEQDTERTLDQQVVAFLGAHPGDPIELAGATLAKHVRRGDRVVTIVCTLGEVYARLPSEQIEEVKRESLRVYQKAMSILGVKEAEWLDLGQPLFIERAEFMKIVEAIREVKPNIVITHHFLDRATPDHRFLGDYVLGACHWSANRLCFSRFSKYARLLFLGIMFWNRDFFVSVSIMRVGVRFHGKTIS